MLRVAIWYENRLGRNDGNPLYVYAALKRMQAKGLLEVDHLIPDGGDISLFGKYDLNVWVDWGEDGLTEILPYPVKWPDNGAPTLYWASDTHLGFEYRLACAKRADISFLAQKNDCEKFNELGVKSIWLPHAVEPLAYNDASDPTGKRPYCFATKKYDTCFVGHINSGNRVKALDRLFKEFPNFFYGQRLFNQAAEIYAQTKVVFNIAMLNDVNMRCFEVAGSGSFLLTDRIQSIEELFEDKKHCVFYDSLDDMVEKARYYITHDDEREAIAAAGYEHVMKNHTIDIRVQKMLDEAEKFLSVKA